MKCFALLFIDPAHVSLLRRGFRPHICVYLSTSLIEPFFNRLFSQIVVDVHYYQAQFVGPKAETQQTCGFQTWYSQLVSNNLSDATSIMVITFTKLFQNSDIGLSITSGTYQCHFFFDTCSITNNEWIVWLYYEVYFKSTRSHKIELDLIN